MAAGAVWSAQDCTPAAIEAALRNLLQEQFAARAAYAPARVLNLVVVVDREWRGEILNRLERVGRYEPIADDSLRGRGGPLDDRRLVLDHAGV